MAKTERIQNMTKGSPAKLIFTFAIPLMLGNVFQQFYTVVDTAIVGQALGVNALAALGAADWLNWLVLGLIQGFAQGFSIYMAQRFGAEDHEGLNRSIGGHFNLDRHSEPSRHGTRAARHEHAGGDHRRRVHIPAHHVCGYTHHHGV